MANGDFIAGSSQKIRVGDVGANRPNSEAVNTKIGASINQGIDDIIALENVVNPTGNIDWSTQADGSITREKLELPWVSTAYDVNSGTADYTLFTLTEDSWLQTVIEQQEYNGITSGSQIQIYATAPSGVERILHGFNGSGSSPLIVYSPVFYGQPNFLESGTVVSFRETNTAGGTRLKGSIRRVLFR